MTTKQLEQEELNILTDKGFEIPVTILGIKKTFRCKKLTMGRLLKLSNVFITMDFDESALQSEDFQEQIASQYQSVSKNAKKTVKAIAICVTDNPIYQNIMQGVLHITREKTNALWGVYSGYYRLLTTMPIAIASSLSTAIVPSLVRSYTAGDDEVVESKVSLAQKFSMIR